MQPGGFRCCSACLKARHVTNWQLPRLRLYTRPSRAEQGLRPGVALPGSRDSDRSSGGRKRSIWPFSGGPIAKMGK